MYKYICEKIKVYFTILFKCFKLFADFNYDTKSKELYEELKFLSNFVHFYTRIIKC